jgi:hypothetical protein
MRVWEDLERSKDGALMELNSLQEGGKFERRKKNGNVIR